MKEVTIEDYINSRKENTLITLSDGSTCLVEDNIINFIDKLGECYRKRDVAYLEYTNEEIKIPIYEIKSIEAKER